MSSWELYLTSWPTNTWNQSEYSKFVARSILLENQWTALMCRRNQLLMCLYTISSQNPFHSLIMLTFVSVFFKHIILIRWNAFKIETLWGGNFLKMWTYPKIRTRWRDSMSLFRIVLEKQFVHQNSSELCLSKRNARKIHRIVVLAKEIQILKRNLRIT